jgi:hypothetical protein
VRWLTVALTDRARDSVASQEGVVRIVSTKVHAVFDYTVGLLLVISPWTFDFARGDAAVWIPVLVGAGTLSYSLMTDYERGVVRRLPMPLHLALDIVGGVLLAVAPWLFGFAGYVWAPHLIFGSFAIVLALTTWRTPAVTANGLPADVWQF